MSNKLEKIVKRVVLGILIFVGLFFVHVFTYHLWLPVHTVRVDYTIYGQTGERYKSGVYKMRGTAFEPHTYTSQGGGIMATVQATDKWLTVHWSNTSVCVYTGYSDVEIDDITIL